MTGIPSKVREYFNTGSVRIECFLGLFCRTRILENESDKVYQPELHTFMNIEVQLSGRGFALFLDFYLSPLIICIDF